MHRVDDDGVFLRLGHADRQCYVPFSVFFRCANLLFFSGFLSNGSPAKRVPFENEEQGSSARNAHSRRAFRAKRTLRRGSGCGLLPANPPPGAGKCGADSHALCLPQRRKPCFRAGQSHRIPSPYRSQECPSGRLAGMMSGRLFPPNPLRWASAESVLPQRERSHTASNRGLTRPHGSAASGSSVSLPSEDLYSRLLARFSGVGGSSRIK